MTHGEHDAVQGYTTHHPRWFRKRVSTYWWLEQWAYLKFVLRELSSIFVAGFIVIVLLWIRAVSGATLTARATTEAARRVLALHAVLARRAKKAA